jgi:hypothetical protein
MTDATSGPRFVATTDAQLMDILRANLDRVGELTILQRLTRSAGRRDWFIVTRAHDIANVLGEGRPHDAFSFFLRPQFELRGRLDEAFSQRIQLLLETVPVHSDELLVAQMIREQTRLEDCEGFSSDDPGELLQWIARHNGDEVVAGRHPPLLSKSSDEVLTAFVPDEAGRVEPGIY